MPPPPQVYPTYFRYRIRRVFPAYWAQLVILFLVAAVVDGAIPGWCVYLPEHSIMLHNISVESTYAINPVYWTLPIELSFYLCLPAIVHVLVRAEHRGAKAKWRTLLFMTLATFALVWTYRVLIYRYFHDGELPRLVWLSAQLPGTLDEFILGSVAGAGLYWWRKDHGATSSRHHRRLSTALALIGLGGLIAMMYFMDAVHDYYWLGHWTVYTWYSIACVFIAILILGVAISGPFTQFVFENRAVVFIGTISYSMYLWHYPIGVWVLQNMDRQTPSLAQFAAVAIPLILVASALSYYLVERPFLRKASRPVREVAPVQGLQRQ